MKAPKRELQTQFNNLTNELDNLLAQALTDGYIIKRSIVTGVNTLGGLKGQVLLLENADGFCPSIKFNLFQPVAPK